MQRRIELEGCFNFRDLGGYPTEDGRRLRWRMLFRSDALHHLSEADVERLLSELRITGVDLNLFEFDMDLTWAVIFLDAQAHHVYSRYGGRDAKGADTRNTLAGLRHTMQSVLAAHRAKISRPAGAGGGTGPAVQSAPLYIERVPAARNVGGCIHCHQAKEILRMREELNRILVHHTGQNMEKIQRDTDRDFFMTAEQAKEYRIVDEVISSKPTTRPVAEVVVTPK